MREREHRRVDGGHKETEPAGTSSLRTGTTIKLRSIFRGFRLRLAFNLLSGLRFFLCCELLFDLRGDGFDVYPHAVGAEAVVGKSDRPVLVVGPQAAKQAKKTLPWKRLMLACDTASGVTEAARLAGNIASSHHARLTIFHVKENGLEGLSEDQFETMEKMMSREAWLTIKPQCLIRAGDPAKEIIRMVEDSQADLLIMSVHRGGEILTHLRGGILAKVQRMSRSPVMVIRDVGHTHHGAEAIAYLSA